MSTRVFVSFDAALSDDVAEVAEFARELGVGVSGRYTPIGGPLELVPDLRQQLRVSDAVIVIFDSGIPDQRTTEEIAWSYEDAKALVGVRVDPSARVPDLLYEAGAEILDWTRNDDKDRFGGAVQAAIKAAQLMEKARKRGTGRGAQCVRQRPGQK